MIGICRKCGYESIGIAVHVACVTPDGRPSLAEAHEFEFPFVAALRGSLHAEHLARVTAETRVAELEGRAAELLDAWRTVKLPDEHPETCGLDRQQYMSGISGLTGVELYVVDNPCTCGLQARKKAARKLLNDMAGDKAMTNDQGDQRR